MGGSVMNGPEDHDGGHFSSEEYNLTDHEDHLPFVDEGEFGSFRAD